MDKRQGIDTLKRIQRMAIKKIRGLNKLAYEDRLMRCGLQNMEREQGISLPNRRIQDCDLKESNIITQHI